MTITAPGAGGKTGHLLVEQALAAGDEVRALAHRDDVHEPRTGLGVVVGDATDVEDVVTASTGSMPTVSVR